MLIFIQKYDIIKIQFNKVIGGLDAAASFRNERNIESIYKMSGEPGYCSTQWLGFIFCKGDS